MFCYDLATSRPAPSYVTQALLHLHLIAMPSVTLTLFLDSQITFTSTMYSSTAHAFVWTVLCKDCFRSQRHKALTNNRSSLLSCGSVSATAMARSVRTSLMRHMLRRTCRRTKHSYTTPLRSRGRPDQVNGQRTHSTCQKRRCAEHSEPDVAQ